MESRIYVGRCKGMGNRRVEQYFAEWKGRKVGFIGIGVSHIETMCLYAKKGAVVSAYDRKSRLAVGEELCCQLEKAGITLHLGEDYLSHIDDELVFRTPGMYFYHPALVALREKGVMIVSEMEVFFSLCPCKTYGVTGSDGKTTTTTLIATMLQRAGRRVFLGGNIGKALLPLIEEIEETDVAVVELSSFQLISMRSSPDVAVVTNVAPNHLDVHKDMSEYISAKKNILAHQDGCSVTVLNADNAITKDFAPIVRGRLRFFSRRQTVENGAFLRGESLCLVRNGEITEVCKKDEIRIPGLHNVENYLAAMAAVQDEVPPQIMKQVAKEFAGVEHRIEWVRTLDGVRYYNDSIATSPTRTIAGLDAFPQKVILIAGGYDKHIPFAPLVPKIFEKVKTLVLMGHTAAKIEEALMRDPAFEQAKEQLTILHAHDMQEACALARSAAQEGDIVTLSPACASFDLYPNFEKRGEHFKKIVNEW